MKIKIFLTALIFLASFQISAIFAANTDSNTITFQVSEIAELDVTASPSNLNVTAPALDGDSPQGGVDQATYLKYSSSVSSGSRKVTAAWSSGGATPVGTSLKLQVLSVPSGCGTAAAEITLGGSAQDIITGIGSCNTGPGATGALLKYSLNVTNGFSLVAGDTQSITVNFIITDAS